MDTAKLLADLGALLGADKVSRDPARLAARHRDTWVLSLWRKMRDKQFLPPACVVTLKSTEDAAKLLQYAAGNKVPVVPFGAGSGVCGGILAEPEVVVADLTELNRLLWVDEVSLTARVEAGMLGAEYERALRERGFSMGHFPQSIDCSSVGGWVATRAAGQFSTKYGCVEDMLLAVRAVLPDGTIVETKAAPRASAGPDLKQIFLGSEGTLGIVTELTYRIHPVPEATQLRSFSFPSMHAGLEAIRLVMRGGWRPAVLRLYDDVEAARHFGGHVDEGEALLVVVSEGARTMVAAEGDAVEQICEAAGGRSRGRAPAQKWLKERNVVPSFETFLEQGIIVDTIEVAALWGRIGELYDAVLEEMRKLPELIVVSGHSSHSYPQGTNIYFSFAAGGDDLEATYARCWEAAMKATLDHDGTISHHHGIGRVRAPWLPAELGSSHLLLRLLKRAIDPHGIMNPGVMLEKVC